MSSKIEGIALEIEEAYRKNKTIALKAHLMGLSKAVAKIKAESAALDPYRDAAKTHLVKDGELEIDDDAIVSKGSDKGAYVQAWVWVPNNLLKE